MMTVAEAYQVLEVSPSADIEQVKLAYRKAALTCHPDSRPADPVAAQEKFVRVHEAYRILLKRFHPAATPQQLASMLDGWNPWEAVATRAEERGKRGGGHRPGWMRVIRPTKDENIFFIIFWVVGMGMALLTTYAWFKLRLEGKFYDDVSDWELVLMGISSIIVFAVVMALTYILLVLSREMVYLAMRFVTRRYLPLRGEHTQMGSTQRKLPKEGE